LILLYVYRWLYFLSSAKSHYISAKEPYISAKEPYISAKEPYISAKEPYISAKEPCIYPHLCGFFAENKFFERVEEGVGDGRFQT